MVNMGYDSESRVCLALKELKAIDYEKDKNKLIELLYPGWVEAGKKGHFEYYVREVGRMLSSDTISLGELKNKSYEEIAMMI